MTKASLSFVLFVLVLIFGSSPSEKTKSYEYKYNVDSTRASYERWSIQIDSSNSVLLEKIKKRK